MLSPGKICAFLLLLWYIFDVTASADVILNYPTWSVWYVIRFISGGSHIFGAMYIPRKEQGK